MTTKFMSLFPSPYQWTTKFTQLNHNNKRLSLPSAKKFWKLP